MAGMNRPKTVDYEDMLKYYLKIRGYSEEYANGNVSYFRRFADIFFKSLEKLLDKKIEPRTRAWILGAMRLFGNIEEYKTHTEIRMLMI
jgi:hypothetical protein